MDDPGDVAFFRMPSDVVVSEKLSKEQWQAYLEKAFKEWKEIRIKKILNSADARKLLDLNKLIQISPKNSNTLQEQTPLIIAISRYWKDIVEQLLTAGADPNTKGSNGSTALMTAAGLHPETIEKSQIKESFVDRLLAIPGILVDAPANDGCTAMHCAVQSDSLPIIQKLVEHKADLNAQENNKRTPLILAILWDRYSIVQWLLEKGADKNIRDDHGKTAQDYINEADEKKMVHLLKNEINKK